MTSPPGPPQPPDPEQRPDDQPASPGGATAYGQHPGAAPGEPDYPGPYADPGYPGDPGYSGFTGPGTPVPPPRPTSTMATISLVLGLVGLFCCGLLTGIPAVFLGIVARKEIKDSGGAVSGEGLALGGIITGAIAVLWSLLALAAVVGLLAFGDSIREELDSDCVRITNPDGTVRIECDLDRDRRWFDNRD